VSFAIAIGFGYIPLCRSGTLSTGIGDEWIETSCDGGSTDGGDGVGVVVCHVFVDGCDGCVALVG
jgi:hypothetical protein